MAGSLFAVDAGVTGLPPELPQPGAGGSRTGRLATVTSGAPRIRIRLLGLVEVSLDGRPVALGGAKQRALLAMLALYANAPVTTDQLIEGLWGERAPASAAKMVQLYVSQLRRLLDGGDAAILTRGRGYELRVPADAVDAVRFEQLVGEASRADDGASALVDEALALWRGRPLDDIADQPFAGAEIRRLDDQWLHARELAIDAALAAGGHAEVVGELDELVAAHPLRERIHAQRMLALYRSGRQADALEAYRDARAVLVQEAGVEPGPELRRLHAAILDQDPSLVLASGSLRAAAAAGGRPRPARRGCRRCVARRRGGRRGRPGRGRLRLPAVCCGRQRRRHHRPREGRRGRLDRARRWPGPDRGGFRGHHGAHPQQQDPRAHRRHLATDRRDGGGRGLAGRYRRHVR